MVRNSPLLLLCQKNQSTKVTENVKQKLHERQKSRWESKKSKKKKMSRLERGPSEKWSKIKSD